LGRKSKRVKEWTKARAKPLVSFKGTPHRLALAFGIGVMLGVIPGTGAIAAAAVAAVLRLNLPVTIAGALVTNPVTTPFVYMGSYFLGHWLLGDLVPPGRIIHLLLKTVTGNLLLAVGMGLISYLVAVGIVTLLRTRRPFVRFLVLLLSLALLLPPAAFALRESQEDRTIPEIEAQLTAGLEEESGRGRGGRQRRNAGPRIGDLVRQAEDFMSQDKYPEAEAVWSWIIQLNGPNNPRNAGIYVRRAQARMAQEKYSEAEADSGMVLKLSDPDDPRNVAIYIKRAQARRKQGRYPLAEQDATEAIRLDPQSEGGYGERARARMRLGKYEQAEQDWTKLLHLRITRLRMTRPDDPGKVGIYVARANARMAQGKYAEAEADARQAIQLSPNDPKALKIFAKATQAQGKNEEAEHWRQQAERATGEGEDAAGLEELEKGLLPPPWRPLIAVEREAIVRELRREIASHFAENGKPLSERILIDAGSYDGALLMMLSDLFGRMFAVEKWQAGLIHLRQLHRPGLYILEEDFTRPGNADMLPWKADLVLASHVLYNIPGTEKKRQVLKKMLRWLAPQGKLIIVLNSADLNPGTRAHLRDRIFGAGRIPPVPPEGVEVLLKELGLPVERRKFQIPLSAQTSGELAGLALGLFPRRERWVLRRHLEAYLERFGEVDGGYQLLWEDEILIATNRPRTEEEKLMWEQEQRDGAQVSPPDPIRLK
jgi:uncharacterized protein (DUF2062 family)/Flp pilus assembly protein TadD/SAM-dependent methyltransferase